MYRYKALLKFILMVCVGALHAETVVRRLMGSVILTQLVIALILPRQRTAYYGVCLSALSTRRVGVNIGWHSDTLADVFWHCEDPSCAFTYAMTQISIPPHTPSTLIRAAQLKERLSSVSPWPQQPLRVTVCTILKLIAHWFDNDRKVGEVSMSIN